MEPKNRWDLALEDKTFVSGIFITSAGLILIFLYIIEEQQYGLTGNLNEAFNGILFLTDAIALLIVGPVLLAVGATMGINLAETQRPVRLLQPGDVLSIGGVRATVQKVRGSSVKVNGIWVSTRQIEFEKRDREN